MPWAAIAAIASLAASGLGIGETLAHQPSAPKIPTTPAAPTPLTAAQNQQQQAAASAATPNILGQVPGINPGYAEQYVAQQTGLGNSPQSAGNIQGAINQYFGLNAGGNTGFTQESAGQPGGTNILALLTQSLNRGGSPFAGAAGTETGGDIFKGLVA